MGITSLQVCMDSPDWLQGQNISDDNTGLIMGSPPIKTPPGGPHDPDILSCGGHPPADRRLRPHHDQALKCPRCDSTHTKFCYYNNYSLSQPRYFCKTCRRYWTKGGTLRNIPVGGGCRKNKKVSSNPKKSASTSSSLSPATGHDPAGHFRPGVATGSPPLVLNVKNTELQLAFPEQLSFSAMHGPGLFFEDVGPVGYTGIDKYDDFIGMQRNGNYNFNGIGINNHSFGIPSFESGIDNPGGGLNILESCQRLMLPNDENISYPGYNHAEQINNHHHHHHEVDVKPNARALSLEWHDCNSDAGIKDTFGYNISGLGSWGGLMSGYGPSATNPLV